MGCPHPGNNKTYNKKYIFEKAFHIDYDPDITIHNALLNEFRLVILIIDKWEWFIELTPNLKFRKWLVEDNAFNLNKIENRINLNNYDNIKSFPKWFNTTFDNKTFNIYRSHDGRMILLERKEDGRIFMTDYGY